MKKSKVEVVAEICLYGPGPGGRHGWLASPLPMAGKMLGDGDPKSAGMTGAIWEASEALQGIGLAGKAWVYAPGGKYKALVVLGSIGYAGSLEWIPAESLVISMEEILKHAQPAGEGVACG